MAWTRTYGVMDYTRIDPETGLPGRPVRTASTSTVVLEDETALGWEPELPRPRGGFEGGGLVDPPYSPPDFRPPDYRPPIKRVPEKGPRRADTRLVRGGGAAQERREGRNGGPLVGGSDDALSEEKEGFDARHGSGKAGGGSRPAPGEGTSALSFVRLRMFGVGFKQLNVPDAGAPETEEPNTGVRVDTPLGMSPIQAATAEQYVAYIESNDVGDFALDESSRLFLTWVPSARVIDFADIEYATSYSPLDKWTEAGVRQVVLYKDPFVVRVPDDAGGGWLMLVARARFRADSLGVDEHDDAALVQAAQDMESDRGTSTSIGDIVAFHCFSQTFREPTLTGPHLVVDSLSAIKPDGEARFRVWLSAPTGIFCGEGNEYALYVYFNMNRAYREERDEDDPDRTNIVPFDPIPGTDAQTAYNDAYGTGSRFRSGVGVQAVAIAEVHRQLAWSTSGHSEPCTSRDAWPGTLNEPVEYYIDDGSGNYEPLRAAVADAVEASAGDLFVNNKAAILPRSADPAAILVEGSPWFFTGISQTDYPEDGYRDPPNAELSALGDTMFGLWRFAFIPAGTDLGEVTAVFGRDLGSRAGNGTQRGQSIDQITRTYVDFAGLYDSIGQYDADPVWVAEAGREHTRVYTRRRIVVSKRETDETSDADATVPDEFYRLVE